MSSQLLANPSPSDPAAYQSSTTDESSHHDRSIQTVQEDVVLRSSPRRSTKTLSSNMNHLDRKMTQDSLLAPTIDSKQKQMKEVKFAGISDRDDENDEIETTSTSIETSIVSRFRSLILTILVFSFLFVSVIMYLMLSRNDDDDFTVEYSDAAEMIIFSLQSQLSEKIIILNALATLSLSTSQPSLSGRISDANVSSSAINVKSEILDTMISSWPCITIPNFEQNANTFKQLSNSLYLGINPIVTTDSRQRWERYVHNISSSWM
jgi:hypothetical protein